MTAGPDEFEVIARLLRPLAAGAPEALDLADDAALIAPRPGFDWVITTDAIVEGVHYLPTDPIDTVARKLLRVNLSDLAAKGAAPFGYFLTCAWPAGSDWALREAFVSGLAADQERFGLRLLGGDTVVTPGPAMFSATILGLAPTGGMVRRSGARAGDLLQVSGPIGDGWLGLQVATGALDLSAENAAAVLAHFRTPEPRLDVSLAGATAAMDISDGLVADAGHLAAASGVMIELDLDLMPKSAAAAEWLGGILDPDRIIQLATGGDDYQILATAPVPLPGFTVVGHVGSGAGTMVVLAGVPREIPSPGWRHR